MGVLTVKQEIQEVSNKIIFMENQIKQVSEIAKNAKENKDISEKNRKTILKKCEVGTRHLEKAIAKGRELLSILVTRDPDEIAN